jgi:hypothetical protein
VKDYVAGLVSKDKAAYGHLSELLANMEEDSKKNELGFSKHMTASEMKVTVLIMKALVALLIPFILIDPIAHPDRPNSPDNRKILSDLRSHNYSNNLESADNADTSTGRAGQCEDQEGHLHGDGQLLE